MNPLESIDDGTLLRFFQHNKTEMSSMDKPHIFLDKLRDHRLIPEERHQKMIRMKSKLRMQRSLYEVLLLIETVQPHNIRLFWTCVFKDTITALYPTLKALRESLLKDGRQPAVDVVEGPLVEEIWKLPPYQIKLPVTCGGKEGILDRTKLATGQPCIETNQKFYTPYDFEKLGWKATTKNWKRTIHCNGVPLDQLLKGGDLTCPGYNKRKARRSPLPCISNTGSPLPRKLPVTCGDQKGTLDRTKLAKGEPCILFRQEWRTPHRFQELSGKCRSANWKKNIRYDGVMLKTLIEDKHLKCLGFKKRKAKRPTCACSSDTVPVISDEEEMEEEEETEEEEEMEEEEEEQEEIDLSQMSNTDQGNSQEGVTDEVPSVGQKVFKVTCGALTGMLHKSRFATGRCGKCIRTKTRWLTPVEFAEAGSAGSPDVLWKRDIQWDSKPLIQLIQGNKMCLHSDDCRCDLCHTTAEGQNNDDECFVCQSETESDLLMCDSCPRSFHPECHLPRMDHHALENQGNWMCTFCTWHNRDSSRSQMTPEECPVSDYMLHCHRLLLSLYNADKDHIFAKDPCIHFRDYNSYIVTPMWLDKITKQLQDRQYTVGRFLTDIQLIFSNCDSFNQNNTKFRDMGVALKEFYEREVKKLFCIGQPGAATC